MKKTDLEQFHTSLDLNIDIDNSLRRISEQIKLLSNLRDVDSLCLVSDILSDTVNLIDNLLNKLCDE